MTPKTLRIAKNMSHPKCNYFVFVRVWLYCNETREGKNAIQYILKRSAVNKQIYQFI